MTKDSISYLQNRDETSKIQSTISHSSHYYQNKMFLFNNVNKNIVSKFEVNALDTNCVSSLSLSFSYKMNI